MRGPKQEEAQSEGSRGASTGRGLWDATCRAEPSEGPDGGKNRLSGVETTDPGKGEGTKIVGSSDKVHPKCQRKPGRLHRGSENADLGPTG